MPKEQEIVKSILEWLSWQKIFYWHNRTGAAVFEGKTNKRFVRFGDVGSPDIFVVIEGKIFGLEIKNEKGKQSESQKEWQKKFTNAGGKYVVCRNIDDVQKLLNL